MYISGGVTLMLPCTFCNNNYDRTARCMTPSICSTSISSTAINILALSLNRSHTHNILMTHFYSQIIKFNILVPTLLHDVPTYDTLNMNYYSHPIISLSVRVSHFLHSLHKLTINKSIIGCSRCPPVLKR